MTIEEQLANALEKLAQAENTVKTLTGQVTKLEENQRNQNSYITTLEKKVNDAKASVNTQQPQKPSVNPTYEKYMKQKWRNEVIESTLRTLQGRYNPEHVKAMEPEVIAYCDKSMTDDTTTIEFVTSVFEMLYGRALGTPTHAIHSTGTRQPATPPTQPNTLPSQPTQPSTPQATQDFHQHFTPPVMSSSDPSPSIPNVPQNPINEIKDTNDAFEAFRKRLNGQTP